VLLPVYIGSSTCIEPGVEIVGPVMIGANCHLESGAVIRDCLIHDYTRISGAAHLEQKIIFGNYCVDASGHILDTQESGVGWLIDDARRATQLDEWQQLLHDTASGLDAYEKKTRT
jgi:mannose-1-phosphate guanylyltransferase